MATAMNAMKKKVTQNDLRRIMNEQKQKLLQSVKKIDSPLAKYTDAGELTCILCDSVVRSEAVWTVHINSKQHRENVTQVKKKREAERERLAQLARMEIKRRAPTSPTQPTKKLKSILKNANETPPLVVVNSVPVDFFDGSAKMRVSTPAVQVESKPPPSKVLLVQGVPSDDEEGDGDSGDDEAGLKNKEVEPEPDGKDEKSVKNIKATAEDALPEGFFDDPMLDAKARNVDYKDPVEEEWERFQREIKATENMSAAIIAEEQEAAIAERQIDEIDEQIRNWSRVLDLERKKELVAQQSSASGKNGGASDGESPNSSDELDPDGFDEYLDWRAKKSFK